MRTVGLVGAGAMGSALGAGWIAGGARVSTCLAGRSARTRALATAAGVQIVESLDDVVRCELVVSVVPPGQAHRAAVDIAGAAGRTGARPLVADLNAVSPDTLADIARVLADADLQLVDGSISGGPPTADRHTQVYVCGPLAAQFRSLPSPWLDTTELAGPLGSASALKMCTASMYKGTKALVMQAMLTARRHGVLAEFLADTAREWPEDVPRWHTDIALAATKSTRYVDEMYEIARTQAGAGLAPQLFDGVAAVYERASRTPLGRRAPETVDGPAGGSAGVEQVLDDLADVGRVPAAVLFDFSGTLFHIESAEQSLRNALGPQFVGLAAAMRRFGGINGSSTPQELPDDLAEVWARRDLSADAHHAAYAGLSARAGLTRDQAEVLYRRGISADAWSPFPDTVDVLHRLHRRGVPVAVISNIGWDPRPVLARHGVAGDIDVLVLSYERGFEKPDPRMFEVACAELGVAPDSAVMIGDNAAADGASTAVGIPFVPVSADPDSRRADELTRAVAALSD